MIRYEEGASGISVPALAKLDLLTLDVLTKMWESKKLTQEKKTMKKMWGGLEKALEMRRQAAETYGQLKTWQAPEDG